MSEYASKLQVIARHRTWDARVSNDMHEEKKAVDEERKSDQSYLVFVLPSNASRSQYSLGIKKHAPPGRYVQNEFILATGP